MEQLNVSKYRYDLDGLRGLAIAFVVIFHVFVGKVSGGVDVFLLLSGYFFLGAQLRYAVRENANLNPWWPLWRTIRRLVPALVLVLGATTLAVAYLTPELRNLNLANQLEASLGYYQNWELANQDAAYGAASNTVSPLQHLWSMAVQGQFYLGAIIFATLIALLARLTKIRSGRKLAGVPLVLITIGSFAYATWLHYQDQTLNYYSTFSRLWELTLGAVLALFVTSVAINSRIKIACTIIGLLMVLTTGWLFDGAGTFPGPTALYPLGGAALVVVGGGAGAPWLASRFMRWLGGIAYPLYLWHWPILVITTVYLNLEKPEVPLGVGVIAVSLVIADLTHRFIELPLMQQSKRPVRGENHIKTALGALKRSLRPWLRVGGGVAVAVVVWSLLVVPQVWRDAVAKQAEMRLDPVLYPGAAALTMARIPYAEPMPDPYLLVDMESPAWEDGCMAFFNDSPEEIVIDRQPEKCIYGDKKAEKLMYVIGGSHAEQWMAPLDELGKEHGFRVVPIVRQGCPAYVEERDENFSKECSVFNKTMLERLKRDKPDIVVSTSTRPLLEKGKYIDEAPISYRTLWDFLSREGIAFVGLRDNPWFLNADGSGQLVSQCWDQSEDVEKCGRKRTEIYAETDPAAQYLTAENQVAVDTADWFCPKGHCPPVIGNIYVYRDGNHISDDYALTLAPLLWEKMGPLVQNTPVRDRASGTAVSGSSTSSVNSSSAVATEPSTYYNWNVGEPVDPEPFSSRAEFEQYQQNHAWR